MDLGKKIVKSIPVILNGKNLKEDFTLRVSDKAVMLIPVSYTHLCCLPASVAAFGFDGLLCGCGTYLIYHDQLLLESKIPFERGLELIEAMKVCDIEGFLEGTDNVYFSGLPSRFKDLEDSKRYIMELGVGKEKCIEERDFLYDKFFVYTDEKSDRQRFFHLLGPDIDAIDRGGGTYECRCV